MAAKLCEQLPGIFFSINSPSALAKERSVADRRSKTYLSGMLFLWQGHQGRHCFTLSGKAVLNRLTGKKGCSIEDEEWDRGP
jgi:hypothetical protein